VANDYYAWVFLRRVFWTATLPDGVTDAKLYLPGHVINDYDQVDSPSQKDANPAWSATYYISDTSPGTLADADWSFGNLGATIACPDAIGPAATPTAVVALANYTEDATNYIQERSDEVKPQHVVDDGYWAQFCGSMARKQIADNNTKKPVIFYKVV